MRKIFGNNCAKGCLIYIVALVALLVVAAMGLSGLRAKFGGSAVQGIQPQYVIQSTGNTSAPNAQPPANPVDTAAGSGGGVLPTPTFAAPPPPPISSPQPAIQPTPAPGQA